MKPPHPIESLILTIRERKAILDSDLAAIYGVPTFRFNEAFKRNRSRFPDDFAFQLTAKEFASVRARQVVATQEYPPNSSQTAMSSRSRRGATYRPWAEADWTGAGGRHGDSRASSPV